MSALIAIGDIHLRPDARNAQRLRAWDTIIAEGRQHPACGGWVLAGDLFHATSTIADRNAAAARLIAMTAVGPVLIVRGNHDAEGDLDIFRSLGTGWPIEVVDRPACVRLRLATGCNVTVFALPYPHKAALVSAGLAPGADVFAVADQALDHICQAAAVELADARARGDVTLMVGHATIAGAIASNGQPQIGREITVSPRHLDHFGPIAKLFGHIHKPQAIAGAHYLGSIARQDFGEVEAKRYVVVTLAPNSSYELTSVPLAAPALYHVEGTLAREGFTWQVTAGPGGDVLEPPASWQGAEVRVRYRFPQSEKTLLDEALVSVPFAAADRIVREPIAVPDRALRAPEVVAAQTLAQKIEAWANVAGVTTSAAIQGKLTRLEQTDPTALVAEVTTWLASVESLKQEVAA